MSAATRVQRAGRSDAARLAAFARASARTYSSSSHRKRAFHLCMKYVFAVMFP
jgi:hypothetical protein